MINNLSILSSTMNSFPSMASVMDGGNNGEPPLKKKATVPAPLTPMSNKPVMDTIPKPNYTDAMSRLNYAKQFTQKYGPLMQGRGDTPLRINEIPEATDDEKLTAKQMSEKAASRLKLDPALLYASAMEEGMSGLYSNKGADIDFSGDDKFPISGFTNFGLDNFSDFYPQLVKKGYLPPDFQNRFSKSSQTNELKQKVNSANFKTAEDALMAKAAVMKNVEDETDLYAKRNGVVLSPRAKQFFALINYNAGEGNMQKMLKEYNQSGYLKDDKFLENRPSSGWKEPYNNVIRRLKMADALKREKYFD